MEIFNKILRKKNDIEINDNIADINLEKRVDLVKKTISLQKKSVPEKAKVALVLDYSGSMSSLYRDGTVQSVIEKILPLAIQFDDDGELDVWLFESSFRRIESINLSNYSDYIKNEKILEKYVMGGTKYAPVITDVVNKYSIEEKSDLPSYVLFVTDGDNSDKNYTDSAIINASKNPIFWQFIGIGNSQFKYLADLDTMRGREVDNANFFSLNDVNSISDEDLYKRILCEYPDWCEKAIKLNILK
jgi:hypothetical protein